MNLKVIFFLLNSHNGQKISSFFLLAHFFRAGLCKLNESGVIAHDSFNQYCDAYPSFFETREAILLAELISSVKNKAFGEWTKEPGLGKNILTRT